MEPKAFLLIILIIAVESLAQSSFQLSINKKSWLFLFIGVGMYCIASLLYYIILKYKTKLTIGNALWNIGTIVSVTFISVFLFKQSLHLYQWIGLVLACIGVYLMIVYDD